MLNFSTPLVSYLIRRRVTALDSAKSSSASPELDGLPSHWRPLSDGEDFSCVKLETISDEYKGTEKKFQDTMEGRHMITKIERVQNPDLWTRYTQYVVLMSFLPLKNLFILFRNREE